MLKKLSGRVLYGIMIPAVAIFVSVSSRAWSEDLSAGKKVFEMKCAQCHGKDAKGLKPMANVLVVDPVLLNLTRPDIAKMTDADIIKTINNGNKKMLSFKKKLKDDQILAVEKYVRSLQAAEAAKK